ncbi:hypothetical protein P154DRAFT_346559 [Amniculicola lignicola CBS 123094]|uniref:Uncharacterized protein n=1 Tax=Amniculicola lignicola CBS 123094 TaxID=1392246 RepID=A0A6A5W8A4_9PLEO|nr:hypothetical protein P154DRAFT_346559 [Amniculicola lignicola CBS 123094]
MLARNMKKSSTAEGHYQDEKLPAVKNSPARWLRQLRRLDPDQEKVMEKADDTTTSTHPPQRPKTAPSTGTARKPTSFSTAREPPFARPPNQPPPRPPRPDSGVIRDVNAWLDASMAKPSAPIMSGIQYWREGSPTADSPPRTDVRYAIPIVREPASSNSCHIKSFCRRAKKMQVRMPSLLRTKPNRATVQQKQAKRRSTSTPLLSLPTETAAPRTPCPLSRSRSLMQIRRRPTSPVACGPGSGRFGVGQLHLVGPPPPFGNSVGVSRIREHESRTERHVNAMFGDGLMAADTVRPATAVNHMSREDSMGNMSDAPTYFSGPPPPSYRSRAASILSTSSFGCVDGMNSERRQISQQQRAAQRPHGVKGRLKRMAQKAHLTK